MSRMTKDITRISLSVVNITMKLVFYALIIVMLVICARQSYMFGHSVFFAPAMEEAPGTDKVVSLTGDESVFEVGGILKDAGLIRNDAAFTAQALCYEYKVRAGTYNLNTSLTSKEIIGILKSDDSASESGSEGEDEEGA